MSVDQTSDTAGVSPAVKPPATAIGAGAIFLFFALIGGYSIYTDPYLEMGKVGSDPGPAFVPWIAILIVGLGGLGQIIWALTRTIKAGGVTFVGEFVLSRMFLPILLVASLVGLQMAMKPLGFLTAAIIFALPWVAILHWRSGGKFTPRYLIQLPIEAIAIAAGIYCLFAYGINVPFP